MSFPALPSSQENERFFQIQNSFGLRRSIVPLFTINRETHLISGVGTSFRVDPFGTYLTAYHVLECPEKRQIIDRHLGTVFGMMSPGLVYGQLPIPKNCFVIIDHVDNYRGEVSDPIGRLHGRTENKNIFDCVKFRFDPSNQRVKDFTDFLPLKISGSRPKIGDRVMAIGYPNVMDVQNVSEEGVLIFTEKMYGAVGEITKLFSTGRDITKPWPLFEVSCNWPGGMSGGPIFNEDGHVIGLVSSGMDPTSEDDGVGYSFWFQPLEFFKRWVPTIDSINPGGIRGWAVLRRNPWHLHGLYEESLKAEEILNKLGADYEIIYGTNQYGTDEFIWNGI
ncbi:MAG: trypsin-like peptidase domain-containing protein [Nitrospira sp.]|nr:trypsin-like peptidase domain-containing protein [Nitrospira sp.]